MERVLRWVVAGLWTALPFTAGPTLAAALDDVGHPVRTAATIFLWTGWSAGVAASLILHPVGLTALRVLAPAAVAATLGAAVDGHPSALAVGWAAVTCGWALSPGFGLLCVNGQAYANERRFLLRAPGPLLFGPLFVVWALTVTGLASGPLLLAGRRWVPGVLACLVGLPLAVLLVRALHNLSRRWVVFVPAGIVLHDPVTVREPLLFRRQDVVLLGPAPTNSIGLDLTQRALGLALELSLDKPYALTLMKPGQRQGQPVEADRLLFTPTRPGAVVEEAARRRIRTPRRDAQPAMPPPSTSSPQ
ncbi:MAG: hypothetical protein M3O23_02320 [Actinomycetota bacterium]|nr:hypothetical protein [Actinomycetota bacterium]